VRCARIERELGESIEANRLINERWAQLAKYSELAGLPGTRRAGAQLTCCARADIPQELLAHMQEQVRDAQPAAV
jgi:hypothetical protein